MMAARGPVAAGLHRAHQRRHMLLTGQDGGVEGGSWSRPIGLTKLTAGSGPFYEAPKNSLSSLRYSALAAVPAA
jgi:hypothetical protein